MVSGILGSPVLAGLQPLVCEHPAVPGLQRRERCQGPHGPCLVSLPSPACSGGYLGVGDPSTLIFPECFPLLDAEGVLPSSKPPLLSGTAML